MIQLEKNRLSCEIKTDSLIKYENNFSLCDRIIETEYNDLKNYLFGTVSKFFEEEFKKRQKNK